MHSLVISFLGQDCPGIVAAVSSLLGEAHCDIVAVSQTISHGEFAALFTVLAPKACTVPSLRTHMEKGLAARKVDLSVIVRPANTEAWCAKVPSSPFVVTAHGPNSVGLMACLSGVFAKHGVNIENLKAIMQDAESQKMLGMQQAQHHAINAISGAHSAQNIDEQSQPSPLPDLHAMDNSSDHAMANNALFVFEVMVPESTDTALLRHELQEAGKTFSLRVSMQHRDIFEAIHRISPM